MTQTGLVFELRSSSVFRAALAVLAACALAQLIIGASPLVVGLAVLACVAGLAGFRMAGAFNAAAWLVLFFVLGNVLIALIAKTAFVQPLDSHLEAPLQSFLVLTVGSMTLLVALVISLVIPIGRPLLPVVREPSRLRWLSNSTLIVGAVLWYANRLFQDPDGSGFGGLAVFWNLLLMAVIARTAFVLERTRNRCSIDLQLVVILGTCVVIGLIDNSKAKVALPLVAYFATGMFYRKGITLRQLTLGLLSLLIVAALIGPMIHAYRALGIQELSWRDRVALIERGFKDSLVNGRLQRYQQVAAERFRSGYYDYFGQSSGQMLLGRYASIQQIDPVIARIASQSELGGSVVWPAFTRLLPEVIYPDKTRYTEGNRILVQLGLIDPLAGQFPTVPLLAQSYAGYGVSGLLVIPFLTFLSFLLAVKKLGWRLDRNVYGIFFFSVFTVIYAHQGDLGQYAGAVLRTFPLLALTVWLLVGLQSKGMRRSILLRAQPR